MKTIKYSILGLAASLVCFASCVEGESFGDGIYLTGTLNSNAIRFAVDEESSMGLTATSTAKATEDITVRFEVVPELVEEYNAMNGRNCQLPPSSAYQLENQTVTISAGKVQSSAMKLTSWSDALEEGVSYCLPIRITETTGGLDAIASAKTAYILMNKVINIKVANLNHAGGFDIKGFCVDENGYSPVQALGQMTLEMKVYPNSFGSSPRSASSISSLCGLEENFLFRFGDGAGNPTNKLQFVKGSIGAAAHPDQKEHYETWVPFECETKKWIHFAAAYDGQMLRLYIDGEQIYEVSVSKGGTINLSTGYSGIAWGDCFAIGRSAGYARYFDGYVSECRVWNKARTSAEISDGICYVDPTTDGLIAYWRMNGDDIQEDGTILDITGHGYNATPFGNVTYVENQKCPW